MATESIDDRIARLLQEVEALREQRGAQVLETAKSFADAFIKKLEDKNIALEVGLQAFCDLAKLTPPKSIKSGPDKKTRAKKGEGKQRAPRAVETGKTYKDPASGQTWTAGPKGRIVGWLQAHINAGKSAGDFVNNG